MKALKSTIRSCKKCADLVRSRRQAVPGDGSVPARVMFVGLAPGRNGADVTGIPFTRDPSGLLFREMLERTEMKSAYVTNIVKCNPQDHKGRNRTPTKKEIKTCSEYLSSEINKVDPQIIVPLGLQATEYFLGSIKSMKDVVLKQSTYNNFIVVPLYHPSYVIRGAYKRTTYLEDFKELKKILD